MNTTLQPLEHMYYQYDFDVLENSYGSMNNRLFCTFTQLDEIDNLIEKVTSQYDILYNKIFVLNIKSNNEYVITYNVDQGNVSSIPDNTILVHRKKETNTLYTVNALNAIIRRVNNGVLDKSYQVDWSHYQNSFILTDDDSYRVVELIFFKKISW